MSVISGTAYWASITSPNTTFDSDGTWSIDVGNLDEDNKALAEKDGPLITLMCISFLVLKLYYIN